jgi:dihydrofolate reductase
MGKLVYTAITSLDGFIADKNGNFDWSMPDQAVHAAINDLQRPITTQLYGRRLYDVLAVWETLDTSAEPGSVVDDYARLWRAAHKIVFSRSLHEPRTSRTDVWRQFDPEEIRDLLRSVPGDVSIGGPTIAAQALAAGLVDEIHQFINPILIGGGLPFLSTGSPVSLELLTENSFDSGVVHLHYRVR